jgi:hypothetical protein
MEKKTFWSESFGEGRVQGGYYFRAFDLIKFMKLVKVVGLEFEGNNVNVIIKANDEI